MKRSIQVLTLVALAWGATRGLSSPAADDAPNEALYVVTHVDVLPKFTAEGRALLQRFVDDSRKERGAVRIEAVEEVSRPNHSTVVEVWENRRAYEAHLESPSTREYRTKLQPMLGSPFDERLHRLSR